MEAQFAGQEGKVSVVLRLEARTFINGFIDDTRFDNRQHDICKFHVPLVMEW